MKIAELQNEFNNFANQAKDAGNTLTDSISMMQLEDVQGDIAAAVVEIESVINKGQPEKLGFLSRLPFLGKAISDARKDADTEELKTGSMVKTVDRLFKSLDAKKCNIESVAMVLFDLRDQLEDQITRMESQEDNVKLIASDENNRESLQAKNLLIQIMPSIDKAKDRVDIITSTIRAAEASTGKISALLPTLQGDLVTELAIQAGLQELQEFKQVFDATVDVVEDLSAKTNTSLGNVMRDVADLAINKPTAKALARIQNTTDERIKLAQDIKEKLALATKQQGEALEVLADSRIKQNQNRLTNGVH